jgi:6-phosphofructokinase 1
VLGHPRRLPRRARTAEYIRRRPRPAATARRVSGIAHLGGTILGHHEPGDPLRFPEPQARRSRAPSRPLRRAASRQAASPAASARSSAVGGDGSLAIAYELSRLGLRVVGVPKTIDNDLERTLMTFGFDTAVSFATECLDRLHIHRPRRTTGSWSSR